jgi:hypothetical protein
MKNDPNADPSTVGPDLSSSKLLTPERMEALAQVNFEFQLWSVDQVSFSVHQYRLSVWEFLVVDREM